MIKNNKKVGISLVALVITIIVLIILTGTVIVTFMEGGIINKAKEAVFKNDIRTYQEILLVKNAENQIKIATGNGEGRKLRSIEVKDIIPEFKEEYAGLIQIVNGEIVLGSLKKDPYSAWLAELGIEASKISENSIVKKLEVGDYVDYNIEGQTYNIIEELGEDATAWIYNDKDQSNSYKKGEEEITYQDIMWRVLKKDENTVTLVSADPVDKIYLCGKDGFEKGPDVLDEICKEIYGGRNLKLEDVNEILKVTPKPYYYNSEGTRVEKEAGTTFSTIIEEEGLDASRWSYLPENYEDLELFYRYSKPAETEENRIAIDLIFRDNTYWLSSYGVYAPIHHSYIAFDVRYVDSSSLNGQHITNSLASKGKEKYGLRPVVTLNYIVEVDGKTEDGAWKLQ